jgi:hypothetical protein
MLNVKKKIGSFTLALATFAFVGITDNASAQTPIPNTDPAIKAAIDAFVAQHRDPKEARDYLAKAVRPVRIQMMKQNRPLEMHMDPVMEAAMRKVMKETIQLPEVQKAIQ